jgi:predicted ATPase
VGDENQLACARRHHSALDACGAQCVSVIGGTHCALLGPMQSCACREGIHDCRLVVLTGGPGAGKTAVLDMVRRTLCEHIVVLPESATVLFGGGFPRHDTRAGVRAAQDAIFHVQRAMEAMAMDEQRAAVALCDRGTLDGLAYWPGGIDAACAALGVDRAAELARYRAVVHLRTPTVAHGYDHSNPVRTETSEQALALDARTASAWDGHRQRLVVDSDADFLQKVRTAVRAIRDQLPVCCRTHPVAELGETGSSDQCPPSSPGRGA